MPKWRRTRYYKSLPRWKQVLLENPELFLLRYFGPDSEQPKLQEFKDFHRDLMDVALNDPRSLILFPANHGKTTVISTLLPILEMCRNPDIIMTGILKNDTDANNIGQAIQAELLGNEALIRDFGPFQPEGDASKPFAITRMSVAKRTIRRKEPTLALFGAGSRSALGHRSDWTFCDDIIHDRNSSTPEQRVKVKEWFMQGPATQGDGGDSRLTIIGTRFDPEDLYGDLLEMSNPDTGHPIYHVLDKWRDAIVDEETHETMWPERWPWLRLMILKAEMGTLDFNKRLRNIAVDKSRMVFKEEYVRGGYVGKDFFPGCLDKHLKAGDTGMTQRRYAGFDPAIGKDRGAKFCAHITLGVGSCRDHDRCYWIIDVERDQMSLIQQVDLVIAKHSEYGLDRSIVETNSYQAVLFESIKQKMDEQGVSYRIDPFTTSRTNKPDPELGVQAMGRLFEQGRIHIPWQDAYSQRRMRQLVDELIQFPSGRTNDTVMALWFAWRHAQEDGPRFRSINRLVENKSMWGRPQRGKKIRNPYYERPEEPVEEQVA